MKISLERLNALQDVYNAINRAARKEKNQQVYQGMIQSMTVVKTLINEEQIKIAIYSEQMTTDKQIQGEYITYGNEN